MYQVRLIFHFKNDGAVTFDRRVAILGKPTFD